MGRNNDNLVLQSSEAGQQAFEPFVDADKAAAFYGTSRKHLLQLARKRKIPAHPLDSLGTGKRITWRFRLSELSAHLQSQREPSEPPPRGDKMHCGSPRKGGQ